MNIDININIWLVQSSATTFFFSSLYVIFVSISIIASSTFILTPSLSLCFFFTRHILSSIRTYKYTYMHALTPCTILVPILSYYIISFYILSYPTLSYPILSCYIISYYFRSYVILSYPISFLILLLILFFPNLLESHQCHNPKE